MEVTAARPCILPMAYWGNVHAYALMLHARPLTIEACENFQKQTYRNRCQVVTANGVQALTVPMDHARSDSQQMRHIAISYATPWQQLHWKTLVSAYRNSPYFEYYEEDLHALYRLKPVYLWDYLCALQDFAWECIGCQPEMNYTTEYKHTVEDGVLDYRQMLTPKSSEYVLRASELLVKDPYYQVFNQKFGFVPNLSILDLIFNMGPESLLVLERMSGACFL